MSEHYRIECRICGVHMGGCRCRAKDKAIRYDICKKCMEEKTNEGKSGETTPPDRPAGGK